MVRSPVPTPPNDKSYASPATSRMRSEPPWAQRLRAGEDPAKIFEEIFMEYYEPILRFFLRKKLPAAECEDLAQETFLAACRGLPNFRGESRFATWLYQIAENVFHLRLRRNRTQKRQGENVSLGTDTEAGNVVDQRYEVSLHPEDQPLRRLLSREKIDQTKQVIATMPPQMQRCFLLRFDQGLEYQEIADVLQVSIQTVKSHLGQARQRLRQRLSDHV